MAKSVKLQELSSNQLTKVKIENVSNLVWQRIKFRGDINDV